MPFYGVKLPKLQAVWTVYGRILPLEKLIRKYTNFGGFARPLNMHRFSNFLQFCNKLDPRNGNLDSKYNFSNFWKLSICCWDTQRNILKVQVIRRSVTRIFRQNFFFRDFRLIQKYIFTTYTSGTHRDLGFEGRMKPIVFFL